MAKQKIAVLGGGIGALGAVYGVTSTPDWQDKYDITVYQLGWRLGGKGASGRKQDDGDRIEEHGLHIWFGFYENSFKTIQDCYKEMGRPVGAPLATWDEAFKPHSYIALQEYHLRQWKTWPLPFPEQSGTPGVGGRQWWPLTYLKHLLKSLSNNLSEILEIEQQSLAAQTKTLDPLRIPLETIEKTLEIEIEAGEYLATDLLKKLGDIADKIDLTTKEAKALKDLEKDLATLSTPILDGLINKLTPILEAISVLPLVPDNLRRALIVVLLGLVVVRGMIADGVITGGFDVIDDIEFRQWLKNNLASDEVAYCAPVRAYYDLAFAYEKGTTGDDPSRSGNVAAGTALHSILLILFAYKGGIMWKMQAGMGDVVFTPLYDVLQKRGVKFEFFHKITDLVPNAEGTAIEQIVMNKQVSLVNAQSEYQPLIDVKDLPCWPSEPLYDQIENGDALKDYNLESYWTDWQDVETGITLNQGSEFDLVICGIPISALKLISSQLADKSQSWTNMVDQVKSVRTMAMQTWLNRDLEGLGWDNPSVIMDAYIQPFNTWADMSQTIPFEDWAAEYEPLNISYFCGPMEDDPSQPSAPNPNYPIQQADEVKSIATHWINNNALHLWPDAKDDQNNFDWDIMIDPNNGTGEARFDAQYWRANIDPTERYTLSLAGTNQYKLTPDGTDFGNLYLAGDWVNNGFLNVACIEATVISALKAAEAITGYDLGIVE